MSDKPTFIGKGHVYIDGPPVTMDDMKMGLVIPANNWIPIGQLAQTLADTGTVLTDEQWADIAKVSIPVESSVVVDVEPGTSISEELANEIANFSPSNPPRVITMKKPPRLLTRQTHTFVTMDVPADLYEAIKAKFHAAGYDHVIHNEGQPDECLDMTGIAITKEKT